MAQQRYRLTPRESEVALLLAKGMRPKNISEELTRSLNTARLHVKNIYAKMGVHSHDESTKLIDSLPAADAPQA